MHWRAADLVDDPSRSQRTALIFVDEYGHRRDYTFGEVAAFSQRYAAVLRAFGVQPGDRVYVALCTSAKCAFTLLALRRLDAQAVSDENAAGAASTIVADRTYREKIDGGRGRFSADARYLLIGEEREGWARLDTVAHVASPIAGDVSPHDDELLKRNADAARTRLGAVDSDRVWCALRNEDPGWFEQALVQPWLLGAGAVAHNHAFDPQERLDLVRELDVTILLQRADEYHVQLALPDPKRFKMPRLRRVFALDDGADGVLLQQWTERFGVQLTPAGAPSP